MILDKIVSKTTERITNLKKEIPLDDLKNEALSLEITNNFIFEKNLKKEGMSFISEIKKASPSKGDIVSDDQFNYIEIAKDYEKAGASAISILTEPYFFKGNNDYIREVSNTVSLPLLRKDFVVDEYMIYEAKVIGASAVLLICSILDEETLKNYIKLADSLGLSALVEAHDEDEVKMALNAGARIIGVNNRNLKNFVVDFNNAINLRKIVPKDIIFVSESGVKTKEDIDLLKSYDVDAVLIGESLMKSDNKAQMIDYLDGKLDNL